MTEICLLVITVALVVVVVDLNMTLTLNNLDSSFEQSSVKEKPFRRSNYVKCHFLFI